MYPDTDDTNEGGDDEAPRPRKHYPPSPASMSKVPSWISLGVVIGVVIGWTFKPPPKATTLELRLPEPPPAKLEAQPTKLTTIEAVFERWQEYAVWYNDGTQVAYWNPGTQAFTEFYEIRRAGDALYFRSIPKLTRREVLHGKLPPPDCLLRFTETEAQYQAWKDSAVEHKPEPK